MSKARMNRWAIGAGAACVCLVVAGLVWAQSTGRLNLLDAKTDASGAVVRASAAVCGGNHLTRTQSGALQSSVEAGGL